MKKALIAAAVAAACAAPAIAQQAAPAPEHTFTANVGIVSDYLFRGISQTKGEPAIQGGFDYAHSSGLYAGTWLSNVSWYNDANPGASKSLEFDLYGGYKGSFGSSDFGYDLGLIRYSYPGTHPDGSVSPNTTEVYGAVSWKFLALKYSHVISENFVAWGTSNGVAKSRNSHYLELNANYDLGDGWGLLGHVGHQKVADYDNAGQPGSVTADGVASYTDWNIGVSKDVGFGVVAVKYSDTNAKTHCGATPQAYCWGGYEAGKGRGVISFSKTF
ncbi:MAG: TorF family putative porin [Rhodocyclaceae bacterium]|nr:TorF family putative porin [Rhodocyclaceae bacterium]